MSKLNDILLDDRKLYTLILNCLIFLFTMSSLLFCSIFYSGKFFDDTNHQIEYIQSQNLEYLRVDLYQNAYSGSVFYRNKKYSLKDMTGWDSPFHFSGKNDTFTNKIQLTPVYDETVIYGFNTENRFKMGMYFAKYNENTLPQNSKLILGDYPKDFHDIMITKSQYEYMKTNGYYYPTKQITLSYDYDAVIDGIEFRDGSTLNDENILGLYCILKPNYESKSLLYYNVCGVLDIGDEIINNEFYGKGILSKTMYIGDYSIRAYQLMPPNAESRFYIATPSFKNDALRELLNHQKTEYYTLLIETLDLSYKGVITGKTDKFLKYFIISFSILFVLIILFIFNQNTLLVTNSKKETFNRRNYIKDRVSKFGLYYLICFGIYLITFIFITAFTKLNVKSFFVGLSISIAYILAAYGIPFLVFLLIKLLKHK